MTPTSTAARLWALDAPTMQIDAAHLVVGAEGTVTIPLPAFLIEHRRGLVLFDTSMTPLVCEDPYQVFGDRPETRMLRAEPEQRVDRQLARLGFRCEDITHVVLSHTHCDHAGGLYLFKQAQFYIGPDEFRWADRPAADSAHLFLPRDLTPDVRAFQWHEVLPQGTDLFGDGAVQLLHTPGHTPGELSALVRLPSQNIVLTGDTAQLRENLEWNAPDPSDWDHDQAVRSFDRLRALQAVEQAKLWIGHDPRDWADFGGPLTPVE